MFRILCITFLVLSGLNLTFAQKPNVELLLDLSGSMWLELDTGETKIDAAKTALQDLITKLPEDNLNMGLRVYGATVSGIDADACTDSQLLLPIANLDKDMLLAAIEARDPKGGTPIVYALNEAIKDFAQLSNTAPRRIILVTDGQESCGQDLGAAVQTLRTLGIDLQVIGFGLSERASRAFAGLDGFVNTFNATELTTALQDTILDLSPVQSEIANPSIEVANDYAVNVDITTTPNNPIINDLNIIDISGPSELRYNAAPTTYYLQWEGNPSYPFTVTLKDIQCAFGGQDAGCIFQSNPIATPLNPIPLSISCSSRANSGNNSGFWTNEIKIIDANGSESANYLLEIRCTP